jgi:hypothetical protein
MAQALTHDGGETAQTGMRGMLARLRHKSQAPSRSDDSGPSRGPAKGPVRHPASAPARPAGSSPAGNPVPLGPPPGGPRPQPEPAPRRPKAGGPARGVARWPSKIGSTSAARCDR